MRSFVPYLRSLATRPLRKARDEAANLGRLVRILGELGDQARDAVYAVRRGWVVARCPGQGLDAHGSDRLLYRVPDEEHEAYRARLMAAFETWQAGGTDPGVAAALDLVGLPDADVHPVTFSTPWQFNGRVQFDGTTRFGGDPHWAWFEVVAPMPGSGIAPERMDAWLAAIGRWKAGHARLLRLTLDSGVRMSDAWPLPLDQLDRVAQHTFPDDAWPMGTSGVRFDGTRQFDGTWMFGEAMDHLDLHEEYLS